MKGLPESGRKRTTDIGLKVFLVFVAFSFVVAGGMAQGSGEEPAALTEEQVEQLEVEATDTSIEKKQGFFDSFFSILTGEGDVGPADTVTFETTLGFDDLDEICSSYTGSVVADSWISGSSGHISGTVKEIEIRCSQSAQTFSRDFNVPESGGTYSYDFNLGQIDETTDDLLSDNEYKKTVETDSVEVVVEPLTADISADPLDPVEGETVEFDGTESDGFGGIDYYRWLVDGEKVSEESDFGYNFDEPGTYDVKLRVSDYAWSDDYLGERRWESTTTEITVQEDSDGDGIADSNDECPEESGTIEYGGCPPPEDDNEDDGSNEDENDGDDQQDTNQAPKIQGVELDTELGDLNDQVSEGTEISVEIFASDPEGDSLEIESTYNNRVYSGSAYTFTAGEPGNYTLTVEVTDGEKVTETTKSVNVKEVNPPACPLDADCGPDFVWVPVADAGECTQVENSTVNSEVPTYDNRSVCLDNVREPPELGPLQKIWNGILELFSGIFGGGN